MVLKNVAILLALIVTGCSSVKPYECLTIIDSNPPGATISSGSEIWGSAPVSRIWTLSSTNSKAKSGPVTARWISGATKTVNLELIAGHEITYNVQRPPMVEGLDADIQWGIHISKQKQAEKEKIRDSLDFSKDVKSDTVDCMEVVPGYHSCRLH